jgi:predicted enzyme related to lactoylglutathione lyase
VHVLSSRTLVHPVDLDRSLAFYGETLGLATYREFGEGDRRGVVFFLGGGFLEVSGRAPGAGGTAVELWLQVADLDLVHRELVEAGVEILRPPVDEPWGLRELWIADPDGIRIVIVEVPPDHPLRRRA